MFKDEILNAPERSSFMDLTGRKFGKLLVTGIDHKEKSKTRGYQYYWKCICDCGNIIITTGNSLRTNKNHMSCGKHRKVYNFVDLIGEKFGSLLVVEKTSNRGNDGGIQWKCLCDCGKEIVVKGSYLRRVSRGIKNCGCLNRLGVSISNGEVCFDRLLKVYKKCAKTRKIDFDLSEKDFYDLTQNDCYYCGASPSKIIKSNYEMGDFIYNGIDRVDSKKGYEIINCVPCCYNCNRAKNSMSLDEFYDWIDKIYNYSAKLRK